MDLNATLFGQMITFALFVLFTMKYVWPPLMDILEQRRERIAEGLAAAEKSDRELELTQIRIQEQLDATKKQTADMLESAHRQANTIIEEAKSRAREEGKRLIELSTQEIEQNIEQARQVLLKEVSNLVISGAEKILDEQLDNDTRNRVVNELIGEV